MVDAVRRGFKKTLVADVYNVSRKTVTTWNKRKSAPSWRERYKGKNQ
jgi:DNA-binding transcriptional regulator YiaG